MLVFINMNTVAAVSRRGRRRLPRARVAPPQPRPLCPGGPTLRGPAWRGGPTRDRRACDDEREKASQSLNSFQTTPTPNPEKLCKRYSAAKREETGIITCSSNASKFRCRWFGNCSIVFACPCLLRRGLPAPRAGRPLSIIMYYHYYGYYYYHYYH